MNGRVKSGYTILELLIFVAVSSFVFVSTIGAIGGRQKQVQLSQSTKEFDAKIRDIINDVTTGYYPTNNTVSCSVSVLGEVQIQSSTNQSLGTNNDCVYIGKAIQFSVGGDPTKVRIYTLAGSRFSDANRTPATTIAQAKPKAVTIPSSPTFKETFEDYTLLYGLKITSVLRPGASLDTNYGSIAILSDFGGSSISESQSIQVGGIWGSNLSDNNTTAVETINQLTDAAPPNTVGLIEKNTDQGLVICMNTPEGKIASISFGSRGSSATNLQVDDHYGGCS